MVQWLHDLSLWNNTIKIEALIYINKVYSNEYSNLKENFFKMDSLASLFGSALICKF